MKKLLFLILFTAGYHSLFAQTHVLPKFIRNMFFEKDSSKRSSMALLPVLSSSPETGFTAGGTALYSFYNDTVSLHRNVSNIFGYAALTAKRQTTLTLNSNYWLPGNKYHLFAGVGYINFPFNFYGIGNDTRLADEDKLSQKRFKLNLEAERKIGDYLYLGIVGGGIDYRFGNKQNSGIYDTDPLVETPGGGASLYTGPSIIFDSRNSNTYTTKGAIVTTYLNLMHGIYDDRNYKGAFFNIEYSEFFALNRHLVLGLDMQEQSLIGGQAPFYLLPELGNDEIMRGYYGGRFRDRNFIAGQMELRYRITDRFGLAWFAGTGEVAHNNFSLHTLKPDYGWGSRYFFDVQKGLSIRADYGVGEKRPGEPRQSGLYIALGESF